MADFQGTAGNDNITGTANADLFKLQQGGNDTVFGKGGNDEFRMGAALTAADTINGGAGFDKLILEGAYAGLIFAATTMVSVQSLIVKGAFDYAITLDDGNVDAGELLTVDAGALAAGHRLGFDGQAELNGKFTIIGGAGDDVAFGGGKADKFNLTLGGNEEVYGNGGKDTFDFGNSFDEFDFVNGGDGSDTLKISGMGLADDLFLNDGRVFGIDRILVTADALMTIEAEDGVIAAGETLFVDGTACATEEFLFSAFDETDGRVDVVGGGDTGFLFGGALSDTLRMSAHTGDYDAIGGGGADEIHCSTGIDAVTVHAVAHSASTTHDVVIGFNAAAEDKIDIDTAVTSVVARSGTVNNATFDSNMGAAIGDTLHAGVAVIFSVTGGDLIGRSFLVVDGDGAIGYNAGLDYVIDVTGFSGAFDTTDFL